MLVFFITVYIQTGETLKASTLHYILLCYLLLHNIVGGDVSMVFVGSIGIASSRKPMWTGRRRF